MARFGGKLLGAYKIEVNDMAVTIEAVPEPPQRVYMRRIFYSSPPSLPSRNSPSFPSPCRRHYPPLLLPNGHGHHSPPSTNPRQTTPSRLLLSILPPRLNKPCMGDPASDHGFLYDEQGRVDILNSPFFDVSFGNDRTADEYVDRVIYQLTLALEDRLPRGPWYIVSNPLTSPNPTSRPAAYTLQVTIFYSSPPSLPSRNSPSFPSPCRRHYPPLLLPNGHGHHSPPSTNPRQTTPSRLLLSILPPRLNKPCMGDPASDHGFLYDEQGRVDILNSPFFDVSFGNDRTADEYVDRVIYQLTLALEDRLPRGPWYIVSNPLTSPNPTSRPAAYTLQVTCLLVALLSALAIFSR
ncbi:hypothetical protein M5K25_010175 [Dendrobium thyrsiflorum]|uniref:Uncharacterized protein n=1 Tax=Dendrobium thyrsiflorum TaxID=117978 RepID=A0ABD0UZZ9_DENTH